MHLTDKGQNSVRDDESDLYIRINKKNGTISFRSFMEAKRFVLKCVTVWINIDKLYLISISHFCNLLNFYLVCFR